MTKKKFIYLAGVFLLGCILMCSAILLKNYRPKIEWNGEPYNIENVNSLDAKFMNPYNKTLDDIATALIVISIASSSGFFLLYTILKTQNKGEGIKKAIFDSIIFLECYLYSTNIYNLLKNFVGRIRPYMYFLNPSEKGVAKGDFFLSWPSGHSASVFVVFGFMINWFCSRYPDSKFKKPLLCFYFVLGISTMILRMLSGNHFLTDVLSGALLGCLTATFVFKINNKIWQMKE